MTKEQLQNLYLVKKLSTWKIEKKLLIPRGTVHRKLKEYDIPTRDLATANLVNPRKNFSGDLKEKAYLVGFRLGDFWVRKICSNSKTITVASGSKIKAQIDLIEGLFKRSGAVRIKTTKDGRNNIWVGLNESFDFLLSRKFPGRVKGNKEYFFAFLAGFTDAEGGISLTKKVDYYALSSCDQSPLLIIKINLEKFGIFSPKIYFNKRKGKVTFNKYRFKSDYWSIRICDKKNLLKLLVSLKQYIPHKNKVKVLNIAIENINKRNNAHKNKTKKILHNHRY